MADLSALLNVQQGQQAPGNPLFAPYNGMQVLPRSADQNAWKAQAQANTAAINSMPYVLDPNRLTNDPAKNKEIMYPAMLQPGGAPYTAVAGKNVGPDLQAKMPGADWSGADTLDKLVTMVTQKTGMSSDEAHKFIIGLIPNVSSNGMYSGDKSSTDTSGGLADAANNPNDFRNNAGYWNSTVG